MISAISCSQNKKTTISDFCQLHEPLQLNIELSVVNYIKEEQKIISEKNKEGGLKTPEEKFVEIMINYAGTNDIKYYEKECDKINN